MTQDTIQVLLVGDPGTGKTSLLSRLIRNDFDSKCERTNGIYYETYDMIITSNNKTIKANIWNTSDRNKYRSISNLLFRDAAGILLVYDISNSDPLDNGTTWLKEIIPLVQPKTIIKLVGNKNDLHDDDNRGVSIENAKQFVSDHGLSFIETSALNGTNVVEAFQSIIHDICMLPEGTDSKDIFSTSTYISHRMIKEPFKIVLVDIKKAAQHQEIHCIQKPLEDDHLKYVALSYRWGELQETVINTHADYNTKTTSFDLKDFYQLCYWMTQEIDLKVIDYVWVDAICVDQANVDRRKATIYEMSNIYERAHHIVAVPDLHIRHLKNTSSLYTDIAKDTHRYRDDIYHLIHGHMDQLDRIDEKWLNEWNVPPDDDIRQLLKRHTDHFTHGFMNHCQHPLNYNADECLDHIYHHHHHNNMDDVMSELSMNDISELDRLHSCEQQDCPLDLINDIKQLPTWRQDLIIKKKKNQHQWNQQMKERSTSIRRSMNFMADLIKDWSSRVWVISEYNIARRKKKMKYWFTQLALTFEYDSIDCGTDNELTFFEFDFENPWVLDDEKQKYDNDMIWNDPVYITFHQTMVQQLNKQTFFEMMLKSKTTKNEDRFYAIFPLTDYKHMIENKTIVEKWKIDTLVSVKLKLFQVMHTKDKLNFLFFCGHPGALLRFDLALPTFATSSIHWESRQEHFLLEKDILAKSSSSADSNDYNFDLNDSSIITLFQTNTMFYLNLKPKEFYINTYYYTQDKKSPHRNPFLNQIQTLTKQLSSSDDHPYVLVAISNITRQMAKQLGVYSDCAQTPIYLIGSFEKNIWILCMHFNFDLDFLGWTHHLTKDDHSIGFNIY